MCITDTATGDDGDADDEPGSPALKRNKSLSGGIVLGVPIKPMLARPTKVRC